MKRKMNGDSIFLTLIAIFLIYILVNTLLTEKDLKNNGIETTAIVRTCRHEYINSSAGWTSRAFYYVNGREYNHSIKAIIPIGTRVKIRYAPRYPTRSTLVNPHEFDNYPKSPEDIK